MLLKMTGRRLRDENPALPRERLLSVMVNVVTYSGKKHWAPPAQWIIPRRKGKRIE